MSPWCRNSWEACCRRARGYFVLDADPHKTHDRLVDPGAASSSAARVAPWRRRLIARLRDRPEGFVDGDRLVPGRPHTELMPAPVAT